METWGFEGIVKKGYQDLEDKGPILQEAESKTDVREKLKEDYQI